MTESIEPDSHTSRSLVRDAALAGGAGDALFDVRSTQELERLAVPGLHEGLLTELAHRKSSVVVEATGRQAAVVGDVPFREDRPTRQRRPQRTNATRIAGRRHGAIGTTGQPSLTIQRQPVVFVEAVANFIDRAGHFFELIAIVLNAGSVQAALVAPFVSHTTGILDVRDDGVKVAWFDFRYFVELFGVGVVEAEFEAIESGGHARFHVLGRGQAPIGREEDVRVAALFFGVRDRFVQPLAKKRLAQVEHAEFLDATFAHLRDHTGVQVPLHIGFGPQSLGGGAKETIQIAPCGQLDLHAAWTGRVGP